MNQYGKIMEKNTNTHTIPVCKAGYHVCKKYFFKVRMNKMCLCDSHIKIIWKDKQEKNNSSYLLRRLEAE